MENSFFFHAIIGSVLSECYFDCGVLNVFCEGLVIVYAIVIMLYC